MSYLVLARKYRPTTFDEVVGQESTATTLKNAVASGRVAHAYLFTGPRGVGKTTMARILAKALNCETGPTASPCNRCALCKSIDTGEDVDVVEIDGASNTGVDDVRLLRENARYAPARARHKIYIIDEVHMLSTSAFNALLKTLEEPPPHVKFIFATTEPHKLLDTVRSRCQRFDFRRIPTSRIAEHLAMICKKEKIKTDKGVLESIARSAHGGMRDAQSMLDQLAALAVDKISVADLEQLLGAVSQQTVFDLIGAVAGRDARRAVELADSALAKGAADDELIQQLMDGFRELLLLRLAGADTPLVDRGEAERRALADLAGQFTPDALMYLVQMFAEVRQKARRSTQSRVVLELALIKAAEVHQLRPLDEILSRLRALQSGGRPAAGAGANPAGRPAPPAAAPTPASEAPTPPPAAPLAPTGNLWTDALAVIEREKAPLATFLGDAALRTEDIPGGGAGYVVELDPVGMEQAESNRELIERALSRVSGTDCRVQFRAAAARPAAGAAPAPRPGRAAKPKGEHVRKAIDLLNAKIVATHSNPRPSAEGGT